MIEKINAIVARELTLNQGIVAGSLRFSECGMDSLDFAALIQATEAEFSVRIPDDRWMAIDTPLDLLREVEAAAHVEVSG